LEEKTTMALQKIRTDLRLIDEAGKALADKSFPVYKEKQEQLRLDYKAILDTAAKSKKEKDDEEAKIESMSKEKRDVYRREQRNKKHVRQMTKQEREQRIDSIMERLYWGLDELMVPPEYQILTKTKNQTINSVNYFNIVISMQQHLSSQHPGVFPF
jgi:hypothetical protein